MIIVLVILVIFWVEQIISINFISYGKMLFTNMKFSLENSPPERIKFAFQGTTVYLNVQKMLLQLCYNFQIHVVVVVVFLLTAI